MDNESLVTVCMLSYNHEKYIEKAINGVLMQKTTFKFSIVIHDDASSDKSQEIILKYTKLYPDKIIPIFQKENVYSKGINIFYNYLLPFAKTKYLAWCECDDFWIDENKLQKQISFLEKHEDFYAVGHNVRFVDDNGDDYKGAVPKVWTKMRDYEYTKKHANKHYVYSQTAAKVHRNYWLKDPEKIFSLFSSAKHVHGDMKNSLLCVCLGRVWIMHDVMSCYRKSFNNHSYTATSLNKNQCERKIYSLQEKKDIGREFGVFFDFKSEYKNNLFVAYLLMKKNPTSENNRIYDFVLKHYPYRHHSFTIFCEYVKYFASRIKEKVFHSKYI